MTFTEFSKLYIPRIDRAMEEFWESRVKASGDPVISDVYQMISEYCLRPGKRIRPLLLLIACKGYSDSEGFSGSLIKCAALIEIMHSYLLVHDDIIDKSEIRRGGPALHRMLVPENPGLSEDLAIVAGDTMAFEVIRELSCAGIEPTVFFRFMKLFGECYTNTCKGQYLDCLSVYSDDFTDGDTPFRVASLKTAYYTIVYPFLFGLVLSGNTTYEAEHHRLCEELLFPLGIAFQLRDDVIGAFARSDESGKPSYGDIDEGKITSLVVKSCKLMSAGDRERFTLLYHKKNKSEEEVFALRDMMLATAVLDVVKDELGSIERVFVENIGKLGLNTGAAMLLEEVAGAVCRLPEL